MSSATMTGAILGSPCYMAPEQARGLKNVDPRTDLYSVGTLLYECVTGRVPFDGDNFNDLMFKIALAPRPNPLDLRPDLDPSLAAVLVKAIQADANERFQTAEQFRDALAAWLESQGIASLRTPELRRPSRTTPRVGDRLAATPTPSARMEKPGWVEATAAVDSGASTPLSAASSFERQPGAAPRKTPVFAAMAGFVLFAGLAGTFALRQLRHPQPVETTASSAASTEPAAHTATPAAVVALPALATGPLPDSTTAELQATASASARPGSVPVPSGAHPAAHPLAPSPHPPGPSKPASPTEPPKSAEVAAGPPSPIPPAPPPTRSVESVEGRTIQTGL